MTALASPRFLGLARASELYQVKVKSNSINLFRDPDYAAEVIGRYPKGTALRVDPDPKDGFYRVGLSRDFKGADHGWIPVSDVEVLNGGVKVPEQVDLRERKFKARAGGRFGLYSPSSYTKAIGSPSGSYLLPIGVFELEYQLWNNIGIWAQAGFNVLSIQTSRTADTKQVLNFSSLAISFLVGGHYAFIQKERMSLAAGLGGGVAYSSNYSLVSSGTQSWTANNPQVTSGPLVSLQVNYEMDLYRRIGFFAQAGYLYWVVTNLKSPESSDSAKTEIPSDLDLSSPFLSLGVRYRF